MKSSCPASVQLRPPHDKAAAARFLATLAPSAQRFTFQLFSDGDDGYAEVFHGTLDEFWPKVMSLNIPERRIGAFVTINETDFAGRRVENIVRPRALFADADGAEQIQQCREVIRATGATPTIVVQTSRGRAHFYWCCHDVPREQFSKLQSALIAKLGTDPAVKDLSRVMRLPGTLHLKEPKVPTTVTFFVQDQRWSIGELSARLGLTPALSVNRLEVDNSVFTRADAERLRRFFGAEHFIVNELGTGIETNSEEIKSAVAAIPPAAIAVEHEWGKLARGLAHEARMYPAQAEELWQVLDRASAAAPGYDAADNRRRWQRYMDEAFNRDNPITIGTVLHMARIHGWQGWTPSSYMAPMFQTVDPARVPRHRQWAYGTKLIKGEITVLAAKGGWGKSAYAVGVMCSVAAGRDLLGEKVWGGPKRAVYINSEDDVDEVRRRFIAAYHHYKMTSAEIANVLLRGVDSPGHQTLTTGDDTAAQLNEAGFTMLDHVIEQARAEVAVVDPLGPLCPAGLNSNGTMGQVLLRLKCIARKHQCAIAIVHHTRKDGDLTSTDAIGGASAIVNQGRVALLVARMTSEEAKKFSGVLDSELWRYIRIVDAKTNLAPPSADTRWFRMASCYLANAEPPTYSKGDSVQVVEPVMLAQLSASPVSSTTDDAARHAILSAAYRANPPFSPSARGGSDRYIVHRVLNDVRQATGLTWGDRDLRKHVSALVSEMTAVGWLQVEEVKIGRNVRQGIIVDASRTPWPSEFGTHGSGAAITAAHQMHQKSFEAIDAQGTGDIDAPRPTGASNVPIGSGDLTKHGFDAGPAPAAEKDDCAAVQPRERTSAGASVSAEQSKAKTQRVETIEPAASTAATPPASLTVPPASVEKVPFAVPATPSHPGPLSDDDLTIPDFMRRT